MELHRATHLCTVMSQQGNTLGGHSRDSSHNPSDPLLASERRRDSQEWCPTEHLPKDHSGKEAWMDVVSGPLFYLFFFKKHQPDMRWFEKESYGIKFLELPSLSLLPSLYKWLYVLSDPTTETHTDKAWGVTLYKQVTEDRQWPSEPSGAAWSRNSSLGLRQLRNFCPCQLAQAESSLGCMNCDDRHWERAVKDTSENSRPCCLFTFCMLHFYSGDRFSFLKCLQIK